MADNNTSEQEWSYVLEGEYIADVNRLLEVVAAAHELLKHRNGTLPFLGNLQDNDSSRLALDTLAKSLDFTNKGANDDC